MLTSVEVRTLQGDVLTLPMDDSSNGIVISEITGLDPVKATLVSSSFAGTNGERYQSSKREKRNIIIKLSLEPDYVAVSVSDLRKRLYKYLMPESEVFLRFYMSDGLYVDIDSRVESFSSPQFAQDPNVAISLLCFDPDFLDPNPVHLDFMTTSGIDEILVPYVGQVDTGLVFTLSVNRALPQFTIYHRPPDGSMRSMDFITALSAGDKLVISTVPGAKSAMVTRAGSTFSVLYGVSPQASWHTLQPSVSGNNYFRFYAVGAAIPFTIDYTTRYGGL